MTNQWSYQDMLVDEQSIENANDFIEFIEEYRSIEKLFDIKKEHQVLIYSSNKTLQNLFIENQDVFEFLTRKKLSLKPLTNSVSLPFKKFDYEIETDQIDKNKIIKKLSDSSDDLKKEKTSIDKNLNNSNFVERAPKDLIEQNKNRQIAISLELSKIDSILVNLNG
jgi:valyl-tRNA synthetase